MIGISKKFVNKGLQDVRQKPVLRIYWYVA